MENESRYRNGSANELLVCVDLLKKDFDVFRNVAGSGMDLVALKNKEFFGIEVKSSRHIPVFEKKLPIENHQLERCDVVAIVNDEKEIQFHCTNESKMKIWSNLYGIPSYFTKEEAEELEELLKSLAE